MDQNDVNERYQDCKIPAAEIDAYIELSIDDNGNLVFTSPWGNSTVAIGVTNELQKLSDVDQTTPFADGDAPIFNGTKFAPYPVLTAIEGTKMFSVIAATIDTPVTTVATEYETLSMALSPTVIGTSLSVADGTISVASDIQWLELSGSLQVSATDETDFTYQWVYGNGSVIGSAETTHIDASEATVIVLPTQTWETNGGTGLTLRVLSVDENVTIQSATLNARQIGPMQTAAGWTSILGDIESLLAAI